MTPSGRMASGSPFSTENSRDRKSTRLNSSHSQISYAVFCLKKKKNTNKLESQTFDDVSVCITCLEMRRIHHVHESSIAHSSLLPPTIRPDYAIIALSDCAG